MQEPAANWDLRRIEFCFPYLRVLMHGRPESGEECPKRVPMSRGHRAKVFSPFDALDGFSAQIRQKDRLMEETVLKKTEEENCMFREAT